MNVKKFTSKVARLYQEVSCLLKQQPVSVLCLVCRGTTVLQNPVCDYCFDSFPIADAFCARCALPLQDTLSEWCASCLKNEPPFTHCLAAYVYDFPTDVLIRKIKYSNRLELIAPLVKPLMEVLVDHYQNQWPDTIIPVPLHPKKLRQRGYNQALLIAKAIAKQLPEGVNCPVDYTAVKRQHHTDSQQGLSAKARRKNIKGAFVVDKPLSGQHVVLVDDVVTTGETVREMSRVLIKQGVQQVDIWCLARTPITNMHTF